jgi:hypothetical protein
MHDISRHGSQTGQQQAHLRLTEMRNLRYAQPSNRRGTSNHCAQAHTELAQGVPDEIPRSPPRCSRRVSEGVGQLHRWRPYAVFSADGNTRRSRRITLSYVLTAGHTALPVCRTAAAT